MDRDGSRTAATPKIERFVIVVKGSKPLTIMTKRSILDVAAALDAPLFDLHEDKLNHAISLKGDTQEGNILTFYINILDGSFG